MSPRADAGFTITELLLALVIGLIIATAAFTLLDVTLKRAGEIDQRVETTQGGRTLMDRMTRELRSQVCQSEDVTPVYETTASGASGSYAQSISFYASFTDGRALRYPQLRTLAYDERSRTITESVVNPRSDGSYTGFPGTARVIAGHVLRPAVGGIPQPIFTYFGFTTSTDPDNPPAPTIPLPVAMARGSANARKVAKIGVRFSIAPSASQQSGRTTTTLQDDVFVRAADPNDSAPTPTCI